MARQEGGQCSIGLVRARIAWLAGAAGAGVAVYRKLRRVPAPTRRRTRARRSCGASSTSRARSSRSARSSRRRRPRWTRCPSRRRSRTGARPSTSADAPPPRRCAGPTGLTARQRDERRHAGEQAARDPLLVGARVEEPPFRRIRQEPGLHEHGRHVGPVEPGQVGALHETAIGRAGRAHHRPLERPARAQARCVDVVRPAPVPGGNERRDPVQRGVAGAVRVDPHHQRRVPPVAELRAGDVPAVAVAERRARARHRHPVAPREQERPRPARNRQRDAGLTRGAAAVLDLQHLRARPDRLGLTAHRRRCPVAGVEADQRRRGSARSGGDHVRRSARYAIASG